MKTPQTSKPNGFDQRHDEAIHILQKAAKTFLGKGLLGDQLVVSFSGGKDSQAIYHLAQEANVPFTAKYSPTTIDPPEVVAFIHHHYPDVTFRKVHQSFWDLCANNKMLPTSTRRFCCEAYKEDATPNVVAITGVRRAESVGRRNRQQLCFNRGSKSKNKQYDSERTRRQHFQGTIDEFNEGAPATFRDLDCLRGRPSNKVVVNPILDWTEQDVWYYLDTVLHVPHCPTYDRGDKRVGCLFCPMTTQPRRVNDARRYPHQFHRLRQTAKLVYDAKAKTTHFADPDQLLAWWIFGNKCGWRKWTAQEAATLPLGQPTWTQLFDQLEAANHVPTTTTTETPNDKPQ